MENNQLATIDGETGEILPAMDAAPAMAVSLAESSQRIEMLKQFVREQMVPELDYGVIPGTNKPSLYKPGAEKLNAIFGLAPHVAILDKTVDIQNNYVAYEVKVTLVHKASQRVEAEGVGSCNSMERKYKSQQAADLANTILKMAKKRALVDATLSATRCSGLFTQDMEDMPRPRGQQCAPQLPQRPPQAAGRTNGQANGHNHQNGANRPQNGTQRPTAPALDGDPVSPINELCKFAGSIGMADPTPPNVQAALAQMGADFKAVTRGNLEVAKIHIQQFVEGVTPDDDAFGDGA